MLRTTQAIVHALLSVDIYTHEIPTIVVRLDNFLNEKLDAATAKMWRPHMKNNPKDQNLSGLQVLHERTLGDLDDYLTPPENGENKDSSTGQGDITPPKGDSPATGDTKG